MTDFNMEETLSELPEIVKCSLNWKIGGSKLSGSGLEIPKHQFRFTSLMPLIHIKLVEVFQKDRADLLSEAESYFQKGELRFRQNKHVKQEQYRTINEENFLRETMVNLSIIFY